MVLFGNLKSHVPRFPYVAFPQFGTQAVGLDCTRPSMTLGPILGRCKFGSFKQCLFSYILALWACSITNDNIQQAVSQNIIFFQEKASLGGFGDFGHFQSDHTVRGQKLIWFDWRANKSFRDVRGVAVSNFIFSICSFELRQVRSVFYFHIVFQQLK